MAVSHGGIMYVYVHNKICMNAPCDITKGRFKNCQFVHIFSVNWSEQKAYLID